VGYFPVFLKLKGRVCVVIGGGKVAERKVLNLIEDEARVKVISPEVTEKLEALAKEGKIAWEKREYIPGDLKGAWLVIAATNSRSVQEKVFQEAESLGIFCNVVDVPELCSFIVPSRVKRGALQIAISTSGKAPAVAKRLRLRLEREFGEEYGTYLELMNDLRTQVLGLNLSREEKEAKLTRLAMAPILECIKEKNWKLLKTMIEEEGLTFPESLFDGL